MTQTDSDHSSPGPLAAAIVAVLASVILAGPAPVLSATGPLPDTATLSPDDLEKGMTGYGKTVFYSQTVDTFGVKVIGVLENIMPDQDMILIKANHPLLEQTKIMSGMSGSPIYINGKLIGALAYGWPFSKESIAGVTPIENMFELGNREHFLPGKTSSVERIATPMVVSGFNNKYKSTLKDKLKEYGFRGQFIAGGQSSAGDNGSSPPATPGRLSEGSAVGIQLMRGDLSMTGVGTVTFRNDDTVYAFGHPFLNAGSTQFPMTTAEVITPMPSLQSSFKLASSIEPVGTIRQDGQSAVIGSTKTSPDMVPVSIELASPTQDFTDTYSVDVVRNKYLSPGLINMAAANFASSKMNQLGLNRVETNVHLSLKNQKDLDLGTTSVVSGSFDPWAFLPIAGVWNNEFDQVEVKDVSIEMTMKPEQEWASIEDVWLNSSALVPGESATVYVRLHPYRGKTVVKEVPLEVPSSIPGNKARLTVVPGSKLIGLQARPESSDQLIDYLNKYQKDSKLAVVLQIPRYSMDAAGHNLPNLPYSISGAYQRAHKSTASFKPGTITKVLSTEWVLQGKQSLTLPIQLK